MRFDSDIAEEYAIAAKKARHGNRLWNLGFGFKFIFSRPITDLHEVYEKWTNRMGYYRQMTSVMKRL
jgi:hypothetical protein